MTKMTQEQIDERMAQIKVKQEERRKLFAKGKGPLPKGTKVSYFRDFTKNDDRVLTIVRKFDKATRTVTFGWSLNHPPSDVVTPKADGAILISRQKGDIFSRREGRRVALERLHNGPLTARVVGSEFPIASCLRLLGDLGHLTEMRPLKRIADEHYGLIPGRFAKSTPSSKLAVSIPPMAPSLLDRIMNFFRGK